jgi:ubiquinone/menaquinone biosynthesis C-methylase UbiE
LEHESLNLMQTIINTSYEPFSREAEYIELNRLFIESSNWQGCLRVLDLACGTGTLSEFIWRELGRQNSTHEFLVAGLDLSAESLKLAVEHFSSLDIGPLTAVDRRPLFVQGSADCLPFCDQWADAIVMGNSIHIFADKQKLLSEIGRVLRCGGKFLFNSSFYAGTFVSGTEYFYIEWMKQAIAYIKNKDLERRRVGLGGVIRKKGLAAPAFSRPWLSMEEYKELLDRCGFSLLSVNQRTMQMSQRSFETVGAYAGLASVLLSGYPVELACEALGCAVGPALAAVQMTEVPRYWLEIVAAKR